MADQGIATSGASEGHATPAESSPARLRPSSFRLHPSSFYPWLPFLWVGAALAGWLRFGQIALFAALGLAIVWAIGLLSGLGPAVRTPLDWPLAFILIWLPVNYWVSADKAASIPAAANLLTGIGVFYLVVAVARAGRRPRWPLYGFLLAGAALLFAILLVPEGLRLPLPAPALALARRIGDTVNANVLAGALLPPAVVAIGLALQPGRWPFRVVCGLLTAAAAGVMALGASRGALMGLGIGGLVVMLALGRGQRIAALILALAGAVFVWRIGPATLLDLLGKGGAAGSLAGRLEIWSRALYALQDFVFTGIGIGTFHLVIPLLYPYFTVGFDTPIPHAHNMLLQVGVDLGLPGLWAYATILVLSLGLLLAALRRPGKRFAAAAVLGALAAVGGHGLFDAVLWGTRPASLLWWLIGLATVIYLEKEEDGASTIRTVTP